MIIIKYIFLFIILAISTLIGKFVSRKYVYRLDELEEMQSALNIFKTKKKETCLALDKAMLVKKPEGICGCLSPYWVA